MKKLALFLIIVVPTLLVAGCNPMAPSYSVDDTGKNIVVTIKKTEVGDITVEIPRKSSRTPFEDGTVVEKVGYKAEGTMKGSRSKGGKNVDYEVSYRAESNTMEITSVKLNGKEINKSAW